tara:strand:+ start:523 stop:825 length:303 start_codon:yes stop_codon:yes gene_type:complete
MDKTSYKELYAEALTEISELKKKISILDGTYRGDEWIISQYNRNRAPEDHVSTIEEMEKKVAQMFNHEKYIYEHNPDTGETFRRKFGEKERELVNVDKDV